MLVHPTGGVDLFPRDSPMRRSDFHTAMSACGVEHELLDAAAAMRRWPELHLDDDVEALFHPDGGVAAAATANAPTSGWPAPTAPISGPDTRVAALSTAGGEVVLRTDGGQTIRAAELVVCAGPWTADILAMLDLRLQLRVTREQVVYLEPLVPGAFEIGRFPVWIWFGPRDLLTASRPSARRARSRSRRNLGGYETTAAGRDFETDEANLARVRGFVRRRLPRAAGRERLVKTCLYTLTPDRDFIIDRVPGQEHVHFAVGCGHAFKFATQIGRMFADLALDGTTPHDLSLFRSDRSVLSG